MERICTTATLKDVAPFAATGTPSGTAARQESMKVWNLMMVIFGLGVCETALLRSVAEMPERGFDSSASPLATVTLRETPLPGGSPLPVMDFDWNVTTAVLSLPAGCVRYS